MGGRFLLPSFLVIVNKSIMNILMHLILGFFLEWIPKMYNDGDQLCLNFPSEV